jgi:hypothetical protein
MANLIFVQLETTGFDPNRDQVIIIAAENESGISFCRRIVPSVTIKPEARETNGLTVIDGCLYYGYDPLFSHVVSRRKAWSDFIEFISTYPQPILIGYQLHELFVRRELQVCDLIEHFEKTLMGRVRFVDMATIFKDVDPESDGELSVLARRHLDRTMETWELFPIPLYRVQLVRGLLNVLGVTTDTIERYAVNAC